jgi:hypothetical protein
MRAEKHQPQQGSIQEPEASATEGGRMTEEQWLTEDHPRAMLEWLRGKASDRKLRLFAVACARRSSMAVPEDALAVAERHADGLATEGELAAVAEAVARSTAPLLTPEHRRSMWGNEDAGEAWVAESFAMRHAPSAALAAVEGVIQAEYHSLDGEGEVWRRYDAGATMREIIGNPFRPVVVPAAWLTRTVVSLAGAVYEERAFDRLPILADALEDAGCTDQAILNHSRGPGPHVRGCWVVDLLLGKQ